jgi:hypothetical protein
MEAGADIQRLKVLTKEGTDALSMDLAAVEEFD